MRTPAYTESAAVEASRRTLLAPGWKDDAVIREAVETSGEISASDFVGHTVRVKIDIEKKRGSAPRNVISDYAASDARVLSLREVAS
jgi:hypothetical protein